MTAYTILSARIAAVIEPERGANVARLGWASDSDHNVLADYDWDAPLPRRDGPGYGDSALDWLSGYRGGWQLLTPNAGDACVVDGIPHPVHGEVSLARWSLIESSESHLELGTATHGPLAVRRRFDVEGARLTVKTTLSNDTGVDAWAIFVEHLAFEGGDDAVVRAAPASLWSADADEVQPEPWPRSDYSSRAARGESRVGVLRGDSGGWIEFERPARGHAVRVEWDADQLPYLWQWYERGSPTFPWFGRPDIVGLEPSSSSRSTGLGAARDRGEAWHLSPGESVDVTLDINIRELG